MVNQKLCWPLNAHTIILTELYTHTHIYIYIYIKQKSREDCNFRDKSMVLIALSLQPTNLCLGRTKRLNKCSQFWWRVPFREDCNSYKLICLEVMGSSVKLPPPVVKITQNKQKNIINFQDVKIANKKYISIGIDKPISYGIPDGGGRMNRICCIL